MAEEKRLARVAHWAAAFALALAGVFAGDNPDTFGHLAQGRQIVQLGRVPLLDTWSLLPGPARPWHNYEWLSDLLLYGLYTGLGYDGIIAFKCLLLGLSAWLIVRTAQHWGGERATFFAALAIVAGIPAARFRLTDRPHVFGLCLAAAYLLCLTRICDSAAPAHKATRRRLMALLFALHVLWINLHGSHLLGLAISGAFALLGPAAARPALFGVLGLEALASCISPYGPFIVLDAVDHVLDPRYRRLISEWNPWREDSPPWLQLGPVLHAALLTLVAPRIVRLGPAPRAALALSALLAFSCFRSIRFVADFILLSSSVLGAGFGSLFAHAPMRRLGWGLGVGASLALVLVPWGASQLPPYRGIGHGVLSLNLPHGPGALLARAKLTPHIFSALDTGWPLMWEAPNARFFIDGRVPFYGPEHVAIAMLAMGAGAPFDRVAAKHDINAVVLSHSWPDQVKLRDHLLARPDWTVALIDDGLVLFARDDLARASGYPRLRVLRPSLSADWVLDLPPNLESELRQELDSLSGLPSARGYRSWVLALRTLASLRRGRAQDGFRWPRTAADRSRYEAAARQLRSAAVDLNVPTVWSFTAAVEAMLCNLDAAEAALAKAVDEFGVNRMSMLVGQEIALRRGNTAAVKQMVHAALARPQARGDAWLAELAGGLRKPPACADR